MKKLVALCLVLVLSLSLVCASAAEKLTIIATPSPHGELLDLISDDMAKLGYDLEITIVTDYVVENPATSAGDVMVNYFQHIPYLDSYNETVGENDRLVGVIPTHFEPLAIYSGTKTDLTTLEKGDKVIVPNDPSNRTRALLLLQDANLIKLADDVDINSQVNIEDVKENSLGLEIMEANAELIAGLRSDAAICVINGNNAALAELNPMKDGLFFEGTESLAAKSYPNLFAVRTENENADFVKALETCVYSQEVYDLMVDRGFVPLFEVPCC